MSRGRSSLDTVFLVLMVPWYGLLAYGIVRYGRSSAGSVPAWVMVVYMVLLPVAMWRLRRAGAAKE